MTIARMLEMLQEKRTQICVVVDEHGGTAGIVTMDDVMEQIVGRIDDEYRHEVQEDIAEVAEDSYEISGSLPIGELVEFLGFTPEEADECETAGGLLLTLFDRIPEEGDEVVLEHGDEENAVRAQFTVLEMDRHRIEKIALKLDKSEA